MRIALRLLIPATVAFGLLVPAASAQTFCVHNPTGCVGTASADLPDALAGASGNGAGTPDTIRIGAGTFQEGPLVDIAGSPVHIVGESATKTVLRANGNDLTVLKVAEPTSTVSDLGIEITGTDNEIGLELAGAADHIKVSSSGAQLSADGVVFTGPGTSLDQSVVSLSYTPTEFARAVFASSGSSATVTDSRLVAATGAYAVGGSLDVRRARIWADRGADAESDGYLSISDSLVRSPGPYPTKFQPYALGAGGTGISLLDANRVTAYGDDSQYSTAVFVDPNNVAGASAVVSVYNSVLWKFARTAWLIESQGHATLNTQWTAYDATKYLHLDPGAVHPSANDLDLHGLEPGFVDSGSGVFALQPGSPLIDAGDPGYQLAGALDLARNERLRDGDGLAGGRIDIGAYEYQNAAPVVSASATPSAVLTGTPIAFVATASDLDVGDSLTYTWDFDDGATATGTDATHAFATAGEHTATVTVADVTGRTASAVAAVSVSAPVAADAGAGAGAGPAVPSTQPIVPTTARPRPRISRLRLSPHVFRARGSRTRPAAHRHPRGTNVHFKLSQRATVALTVLRPRGGRWVKVGTIRRLVRAGSVSIRFDGRVRGRALAAGRYRLRVQARTSGAISNAVLARFRIAS